MVPLVVSRTSKVLSNTYNSNILSLLIPGRISLTIQLYNSILLGKTNSSSNTSYDLARLNDSSVALHAVSNRYISIMSGVSTSAKMSSFNNSETFFLFSMMFLLIASNWNDVKFLFLMFPISASLMLSNIYFTRPTTSEFGLSVKSLPSNNAFKSSKLLINS